MKKIFILIICLFLASLTSCGTSLDDYVPETSMEQVDFTPPIIDDDLKQLYMDNKEVFNNVITELNKLPQYVYAVTFENGEIIVDNGAGKTINEKFDCDYDRIIDCFEILYGFADEKLRAEYKISITKGDYGISFNIRSLAILVDYDIKYIEKNDETQRYTNIEGPWYLSIWGLV